MTCQSYWRGHSLLHSTENVNRSAPVSLSSGSSAMACTVFPPRFSNFFRHTRAKWSFLWQWPHVLPKAGQEPHKWEEPQNLQFPCCNVGPDPGWRGEFFFCLPQYWISCNEEFSSLCSFGAFPLICSFEASDALAIQIAFSNVSFSSLNRRSFTARKHELISYHVIDRPALAWFYLVFKRVTNWSTVSEFFCYLPKLQSLEDHVFPGVTVTLKLFKHFA